MEQLAQVPKGIVRRDRSAVLANATADAASLIDTGGHETRNGAWMQMSVEPVDRIVEDWSPAARTGLRYGPPNEANTTRLLWFARAPRKRVRFTGGEGVHRFPTPHADWLTPKRIAGHVGDFFAAAGRS